MEKFTIKLSDPTYTVVVEAPSMSNALFDYFGTKANIPENAEIKSYGNNHLWHNALKMWPRRRKTLQESK